MKNIKLNLLVVFVLLASVCALPQKKHNSMFMIEPNRNTVLSAKISEQIYMPAPLEKQNQLLKIKSDSLANSSPNYFPLAIGNKWQFYTSNTDQDLSIGFSNYYDTYIDSITSETIIGEKRYCFLAHWENYLLRYDEKEKKLYDYGTYSDIVLMDFNLEEGAIFSTIVGNAQVIVGSDMLCGKQFNYRGSLQKQPDFPNNNKSCRYYYEDLGFGRFLHTETWNSRFAYYDTYLIQAIINDSTGVKYYRESDTTKITMPVTKIIADTLLVSFQVNHPLTRFNSSEYVSDRGEGVCFTDSVLIYSYYVKDDSVKSASPVLATRSVGTADFSAAIQLDTNMLNDGYSFFCKIKTKDKGIIPEYELFPAGGCYKLVLDSTLVGVKSETGANIRSFNLCQNYPNPFNPSTTISYELPKDTKVSLKIYNMLGQEIITLVNGYMKAGTHSVTFNAGKLASGIYLYKLDAGSGSLSKKMILTK